MMYKTIGVLVLAILLAIPTVTRAQVVQLGKPLHCVPMRLLWMGFDQDKDETLVFTAAHTASSHPVMTYWNTKTDKMTVIEFVEITTTKNDGNPLEQQYGCVLMQGDLNRIYDLSSVIKNKMKK